MMAGAHAAEPEFKSTLFKKGTLIYSDDFDGDYAKEWWGSMKKDKKLEDGKLIITARFKNAEEAKKALKRDHHLGLEPVAHLGKIPEKFVCHLRYKFEAEKLAPNRPVLQIGHHMILLTYLEGGGHRVKLPDGPTFTEPKSGMQLNEWVDLIIEYQLGKIHISVNGVGKTYEHEKVTMVNKKDKFGPRFTFKHGIRGANSRLIFDYVRLWKVKSKKVSQSAQETPNNAPISQKPRLAKSDEEQLESHLALTYASYGDRVMKLDLYRPKSRSKNLPAMVCIHGGGWMNGQRNNYTVFAKSVALKGFVAVTIDYRLSGEAKFPAAIHDCKAAVRWLRANAKKYGLNPNKIAAIGSSAGGHLAALLGTSAGVPELEGRGGNANQSSAIQVALPWAAQTDLTVERIRLKSEATTGKQLYRNFLGGSYTTHAAQYALASPIKYLDKQDPPFHFICGELDVPSTRAVDFRKKLDAMGIPSGLHVIDGAPHGFSRRQDWFTEALDRAMTFALAHLVK
jgi:pectinesterase